MRWFILVAASVLSVPACEGPKIDVNGSSGPTTGGASLGTSGGSTGGMPSTGASGTGTGVGSGGTGPVVPGCECIPHESSGTPTLSGCGESPCARVVATCESPGCAQGPTSVMDVAALDCALTGLRDRIPGVYRWAARDLEVSSQEGYVVLKGDSSAITRRWSTEDLFIDVHPALLGDLPPPQDYDDCLANPDPILRFECLQWMTELPQTVCSEGWEDSDDG